MNLRRRLRGILGVAVLWSVTFAGISMMVLATVLFIEAAPVGPSEIFNAMASAMTAWGVIGAVAGTLFAVTVILAERSRTLAALSPRRLALWGFAAGALLPVAVSLAYRVAHHVSSRVDGATLAVSLISGMLGASIAALTVQLARKSSAPIATHHGDPDAPVI
jgi:hypothetical protein